MENALKSFFKYIFLKKNNKVLFLNLFSFCFPLNLKFEALNLYFVDF